MNHYQISSPRKAFAVLSIALTALTIGLAVVVPAKLRSDSHDLRTVAAVTVTGPAAIKVLPERLRVDVIGSREPEFAAVQAHPAPSKRRQDS